MASLMCVDVDLGTDTDETDEDGDSQESNSKLNVMDVVKNEIRDAREKGNEVIRWLELEELDFDDDMLLSLDLSSKYPVSH
uniref:Uncharacterized protein n=1 Tax=Rhizophora mucronata TaxID=61149 RepID=A0A2P2LZI6_RHIMU